MSSLQGSTSSFSSSKILQNAKKQEAHLLFFLREDVLPFIMFALGGNQNISSPKNRVLSYLFSASSTATATATVAPTMGLLPMPRKPIISTDTPPTGGVLKHSRARPDEEPDFLHIRKHIRSKKSLVLWLQRHYITWFVHETMGFWIKVHLGTTFLHLRASLNIFHHPEATLNIFHHLCIIPAWKIHPCKFTHSAVMW